VLGLVETKELDLFPEGKLDGYENGMAKGGSDDAMLACPGAAESDGGLQKCMFNSGEAGGMTWTNPESSDGGAWCA
jgi:hypothetical protein